MVQLQEEALVTWNQETDLISWFLCKLYLLTFKMLIWHLSM